MVQNNNRNNQVAFRGVRFLYVHLQAAQCRFVSGSTQPPSCRSAGKLKLISESMISIKP